MHSLVKQTPNTGNNIMSFKEFNKENVTAFIGMVTQEFPQICYLQFTGSGEFLSWAVHEFDNQGCHEHEITNISISTTKGATMYCSWNDELTTEQFPHQYAVVQKIVVVNQNGKWGFDNPYVDSKR